MPKLNDVRRVRRAMLKMVKLSQGLNKRERFTSDKGALGVKCCLRHLRRMKNNPGKFKRAIANAQAAV